MSVYRVGKYWHYSFQALGITYHASTHLEATEKNRPRALELQLKAKLTARAGNGHQLKLEPMPFATAAAQFIAWAQAEHREHPNTWLRLRGSCASLKLFFGSKPIHLISAGDVEDYKTWRRDVQHVRDVTLRHDLHCLAPLFRFAIKHRWAMTNPVERVDIPSDREARVMRIVTAAEEKDYFMEAAKLSQDLYDLGRLMMLQGPRPWCEVTRARVEHVDLEAGTWLIPKTKSNAGRRILYLTSEAKSILARRIAQAGDGNLFPARNGAQVRTLNKAHERALDALNPCDRCGRLRSEHSDTSCAYHRSRKIAFRIYDLRHTFATRLGEKGVDAFAIAKILGHNDLRTVLKYVHLSDERAREVMLKFGGQDFKIEAVQ